MGHSAFRLRGREVTIVTDPFPPSFGLQMGKVAAEIVTISHQSPNHAVVDGVANNPRVIAGPGEYEVAGVLLAGIATASKPGEGSLNTAFVARFDDLAVCHLGDLRTKLTDQHIEEIGDIDVLLIPTGGGSTIGPQEAAEVVTQLEPSLVIPMHYRVEGGTVGGLEAVETFCREMGQKEVAREQKLSVSRGSLTQDVRVAVLEHRRV